jgi:mRNA interferase MazF
VVQPRRAEVWRVDFNPTKGTEIQKIRPAVVISSDAAGRLPVKLVAPITEWDDRFASSFWHVRLDPDGGNGLTKPSAVDALQLRGMDTLRFQKRLGRLTAAKMEEITTAIAIVIEHQ